MNKALATFETWKKVAPAKRAEYLFKAAKLMRERKFELCAWMIYEVGKSWAEADADVAEAIDFCDYYGREMIRLSNPAPLVKMPNEVGKLSYIPLGVGLVIPPWNFPLAILVGMTTAAIVSGNPVIVKP
jgi:1-pyrroline-5-carboxylate dehydrogenase